MSEPVRTRFAPSPTGYLHVGGARTALFNYLLAKRSAGRFIIRIEDTDQTRNITHADDKLLDDLRWLGLTWDEGPQVGGDAGPYHQSQRLDIYREHCQKLLDADLAYYAMETRDELDAMRKAAQQTGRGFRYPRPERFPTPAEAEQARAAGRPVVVRFKMPAADTVIHDEILGDVNVQASDLSDFVIQKADGWPTYHFAVVVDDALMRISHVLRGQEHLLNTANHIALQQALGFETPKFAHLPIIFTMQGSKMSKREKDRAVRDAVKHAGLSDDAVMQAASVADAALLKTWRKGDASLGAEPLARLAAHLNVALPEIEIRDFRVSGYLPETIVNFIALLGWSAGDDREKYTLDELVQAFDVGRVGKTNAKFDREKLLAFNTAQAADATPQRLLEAFQDFVAVNGAASPFAEVADDATLARVLELCAGFRTFRDVEAKAGALFVADDALVYDDAAIKKHLLKGDADGLQVLRALRDRLAGVGDDAWAAAALETVVKTYGEETSRGLGKLAQPLRIALTGGTVSPAIFETLELAGREKTLRRVDRLLARMS